MVTGSLSSNSLDRDLHRNALSTVQVLTANGELVSFSYFDPFGKTWIYCLTPDPEENALYFSTGNDLIKVDLATGRHENIPIAKLYDVHEMKFINGNLYIPNTGKDEIVAYQPQNDSIKRYYLKNNQINKENIIDNNGKDIFHLNYIFLGYDGYLYGLVHHVTGKQFHKKIAQRILKSHGNGGCIRILDGKQILLNLYAPHTVSLIDNHYWMLDSGRATIKIYDSHWKFIQSIPTNGWGRGAALIKNNKKLLLAVGLSTIRKRYLHFFPGEEKYINGVQIFDVQERTSKVLIKIENIEQVNTLNFIHLKSLEKIF